MANDHGDAVEPIVDMFYPPRATRCSRSFARFLSDYYESLEYFFFIVRLTHNADEARVRAAKALAYGASEEERARYEAVAADESLMLRQLQRYARVQSRNLTNAVVDAFQRYLSEIIQEAMLKKPELLRSSQTVRIEEVLQFKRHSDLVSYLVDRKINELAYGGIREIERYFSERLGIELFVDQDSRKILNVFVELRNINVHNRGIVNDLFLSRVGKVGGFTFRIGRAHHVDLDEFARLAENAIRVGLAADGSVAEKFRLRRSAFSGWQVAFARAQKASP